MNRIDWWSTSFGKKEVAKIEDSILNRKLSQGSVTEEFEKKFADMLGVPYALCVPSGTSALFLALYALGVRYGDEVIVPDCTAIATANSAYILGAKIIFVDVKSTSPVMDVNLIENKITSKTKAIIPVHYNGIYCDMDKINKIANKHNLFVVEDAAQAMFSKHNSEYMGKNSNAGCFSLSVAKLITTGQGGIVVTRDQELYKKMSDFKLQDRGDYSNPCFNLKYNDMQASSGLIQLSNVEQHVKHVIKIYKMYKEALESFNSMDIVRVDIQNGETPLWVLANCKERDELIDFMNSRNVFPLPCPMPLHTAPYFKSNGNFSNSDRLGRECMRLPCGVKQPIENVKRVIGLIQEFYK